MLVCVVFVVLLVASVLASMRWLLCGGDGSKKKNDICNSKNKIPRENFSITVLINNHYRFILIRKNKNLHHASL